MKPRSWVICVHNGEYEVSLIVGKVYAVESPLDNDPDIMLRIVDETGEDYLYPTAWFAPIQVGPEIESVLLARA